MDKEKAKLRVLARRLVSEIIEGRVSGGRELGLRKNELCKELKMGETPTNPDVLSFAKKKEWEALVPILGIKPVKTLSGIAAVAVMAPPSKCPGECIYCPGSLCGEETPKSYVGFEPAAMRALQAGFAAKRQIAPRIRQLEEMGHSAQKIELIIMGGTFLARPKRETEGFMRECYDAVSGRRSSSLSSAMNANRLAERRVVGTTFETRPDYCRKRHVNRMLGMGGTRCELGVQILDDRVYGKTRRGHTVKDVEDATRILKDSAFKVAYHMMPGLPYSTKKDDMDSFKMVFGDERFRPDMLKIYPCLVVKGTGAYEMWKRGEYEPMGSKEAAGFIARVKRIVPEWVRVMRIQRDIPSQWIEAGVKHSNLRQIAGEELEKKGWKCRCIRCREAGFARGEKTGRLKIKCAEYSASSGKEVFIQSTDSQNRLFGYARLRIPKSPFRKELRKAALLRELKVVGKSIPLKQKGSGKEQHSGIGRKLMEKAEEKAIEFGFGKLAVIAGVGVKEYYAKLGYRDDGAYVSKNMKG